MSIDLWDDLDVCPFDFHVHLLQHFDRERGRREGKREAFDTLPSGRTVLSQRQQHDRFMLSSTFMPSIRRAA